MKRTWKCPKCESDRIGYFEKLPDQGHTARTDKRVIGTAFTSQFMGIGVGTMAGEVEAFVCTSCGYFEEYVKAPQSIPWDQMAHFRWCKK
jgi:hypothetical protein